MCFPQKQQSWSCPARYLSVNFLLKMAILYVKCPEWCYLSTTYVGSFHDMLYDWNLLRLHRGGRDAEFHSWELNNPFLFILQVFFSKQAVCFLCKEWKSLILDFVKDCYAEGFSGRRNTANRLYRYKKLYTRKKSYIIISICVQMNKKQRQEVSLLNVLY